MVSLIRSNFATVGFGSGQAVGGAGFALQYRNNGDERFLFRWRLGLRPFRRARGAPAQELMQGKGNLVGVRCAPGNDALELDGVLSDGADFHQLSFDDVRVSHRTSSMAHGGHHWHIGRKRHGPYRELMPDSQMNLPEPAVPITGLSR